MVYTLVRINPSMQQDRLRKRSLTSVMNRQALTCTMRYKRYPAISKCPKSSRQERHAGGVDGKSPTELLYGNASALSALALRALP